MKIIVIRDVVMHSYLSSPLMPVYDCYIYESYLFQLPPYMLIFICCTSYRVHSIFVLRLFNDPVAMMFFYAAVNLFIDGYWPVGSLVYR